MQKKTNIFKAPFDVLFSLSLSLAQIEIHFEHSDEPHKIYMYAVYRDAKKKNKKYISIFLSRLQNDRIVTRAFHLVTSPVQRYNNISTCHSISLFLTRHTELGVCVCVRIRTGSSLYIACITVITN